MSENKKQYIEIHQKKHGVVDLILNDSTSYNALSFDLLKELKQTLLFLSEDKHCRVIVISGAGKGFSAGHNLKELENMATDSSSLFQLCSQVMLAVENNKKPVIAKVHGAAFAAGCQLVASCDLAVASEQAIFATPGVNIGLFCSTPMVALSRVVSKKQALAMLLTGDAIDAGKAKAIGLINEVVAEADLSSVTQQLAEKIAQKSQHSLSLGKAAFYKQLSLSTQAAYQYTSERMACNMTSQDAKEGIRAFLEKRKAHWSDC